MKQTVIMLIGMVCLALTAFPQPTAANEVQDIPVLSISGQVRFPFQFTLRTLNGFERTRIRVTEAVRDETVPKDRWYRTYWYDGIPLSRFIDMAHVSKDDEAFKRPMDLVIIVYGSNGKAVLSWPEICNADSEATMIALSAEPVPPLTRSGPHKGRFPRLVVGGDFWADRFIDNVFHIEVTHCAPPGPFRKGAHTPVPVASLIGENDQAVAIKDLSRYPRVTVTSKQSGHDPGYFGIVSYSGASLPAILEKEGIRMDPDAVLLVTSSEGYRAVVSYGELFLSPNGTGIILADQLEGKPFGEFGKFNLICPDDYNADRWVKTVDTIEVIHIRPEACIRVVGVGRGKTSRLTLEGLAAFGKAGAFVCDPELSRRFGRYMGDKPVLFTPSGDLTDEAIQKLKDTLDQGMDVVVPASGGPDDIDWVNRLKARFRPEQVHIIPGVGEGSDRIQ